MRCRTGLPKAFEISEFVQIIYQNGLAKGCY
jgi:hypothetical protein